MKRRGKNHSKSSVKERHLILLLLVTYTGVLFLMSGIHTGIVVFMNTVVRWNEVVKPIVPMLYWGIVAMGLTLFTRQKIRRTYENPMLALAEAAAKVADGDFSVYVPPLHTTDKQDYLDVMIRDFNKMVEELGSIETLKTDFVSNVSHEMKTPIAVIKNYAELMKADHIAEDVRKEYAKSIEIAAIKLSNLISNILKLNKLENQRIAPEAELYDVCRQLCESILQFEDAWDEKEIELETEIEDAAMVRADASLMELVWNNLIGNAIKFTQPGGSITVKQTSDEEHIMVEVSDTGCGMNRESLNHIFDKFFQGDTSHSKDGNGLGLALVKRVLELMDGEIQVVSEEGKGSIFTVTLPAAGTCEQGGM